MNRKEMIDQLNKVQEEVLFIGWNGILELYHPEMNKDDPGADDRFKLYKLVYDNMKQRMIIKE